MQEKQGCGQYVSGIISTSFPLPRVLAHPRFPRLPANFFPRISSPVCSFAFLGFSLFSSNQAKNVFFFAGVRFFQPRFVFPRYPIPKSDRRWLLCFSCLEGKPLQNQQALERMCLQLLRCFFFFCVFFFFFFRESLLKGSKPNMYLLAGNLRFHCSRGTYQRTAIKRSNKRVLCPLNLSPTIWVWLKI